MSVCDSRRTGTSSSTTLDPRANSPGRGETTSVPTHALLPPIPFVFLPRRIFTCTYFWAPLISILVSSYLDFPLVCANTSPPIASQQLSPQHTSDDRPLPFHSTVRNPRCRLLLLSPPAVAFFVLVRCAQPVPSHYGSYVLSFLKTCFRFHKLVQTPLRTGTLSARGF